jgi:hypothetical protein
MKKNDIVRASGCFEKSLQHDPEFHESRYYLEKLGREKS